MKTLKQFINEGLINIKDYRHATKAHTTVTPKDKEELQQIIEDTIKKEGNKCNLNFIDTSKITDMNGLFADSKFNGDISLWDVSNVVMMSGMFMNSEFNRNISDWDVSNVEYMRNMFYNSQFNRNISNWDVSNVNSMSNMFRYSKFNGDISRWKLSKITNMLDMINMFNDSPLQKIYGGTPEIDRNSRHFLKL